MVEGPLLAGFLQTRRHATGSLLAVNEQTMHTNAAARLLQPSIMGSCGTGPHSRWPTTPPDAELRLASGLPVTARVRAVQDRGVLSGALVRFDPPASARPHVQLPRHGATFDWDSRTDTERGVC
ncbi:MAG TPA: hypothetical protein VF070_18010 [Streptosporangiaceae bacterium]